MFDLLESLKRLIHSKIQCLQVHFDGNTCYLPFSFNGHCGCLSSRSVNHYRQLP